MRSRHLVLLFDCGLRRAELVGLRVENLEQHEGRWVVPDRASKGKPGAHGADPSACRRTRVNTVDCCRD
jgi:integrase